jgi:hypothetical protein
MPQQTPMPQTRSNKIRLTPYQAVTSNGIRKDYQPYSLKEWFSKNGEVRYNLFLEQGTYTLQAEYAAINTGELYFNINNNTYTAHYSKTEDNKPEYEDRDNYITDSFPYIEIQIPETKEYQLIIKRNAEIPNHFNIINVRNFVLNRIDADSGIAEPVKALIYPNPVRDGYFYASLPAGQSLRIYDTVGRMLKSCAVGENRQVDVSDLPTGIYIVIGDELNYKLLIIKNPV